MSLRLLALASLATLGLACAPPVVEENASAAGAIVGGTATKAYPAVGYVESGDGAGCTGFLVATNVVVTAAHCLNGLYRSELVDHPPIWFFQDLTGAKKAVGSESSSEPLLPVDFHEVRVETAVVEEGYCGADGATQPGQDLAYLVLSESLDVKAMKLAADAPPSTHAFVAIGYGATKAIKLTTSQATAKAGIGQQYPLCSPDAARPATAAALFNTEDGSIDPRTDRNELTEKLEPALSRGLLQARSTQGSVCAGDSGGPLIDTTTGEVVAVANAATFVDGEICRTNAVSFYVPVAGQSFLARAVGAGKTAQ